MEISNMCRSCIIELNEYERTDELKTMEMFTFCTNIQETNDELPNKFCHDCTKQIHSTYSFIKKAQENTNTLRKIALRMKSTVIVRQNKDKSLLSVCDNDEDSKSIIQSRTIIINNEVLRTDIKEDIDNSHEQTKLNKCKFKAKVNSKKNCPKCNKSFVSKIWLKKHIENECSDREFECNICNKKFTKKSKLSEHKICHSDHREYVCNACGRQFQRRKQLTAHMVTHSTDRPYTCDVCSKSFKLKKILTGHMKIHQDIKQYLCSFCGWSTAQANNLSVHMRTHTGAKPFACDACPFLTGARSSLRRHALRHAPPAPHAAPPAPHACTHCGKPFRDASSLSRHRRTHTGERPYVCPRCPRAFADSWKRKHHLMRAHGLLLRDIPRMRTDGRAY